MQELQFVKTYLFERERAAGEGRKESPKLSVEPNRGLDLTTLRSPPYGNQESDA